MNKTEIAKAFITAYEEQAQSLFDTYLDNAEAYTTKTKLKDKGMPWEKAKAFDGSALIGEWINKSEVDNLYNLNFSLEKNGIEVQCSNTANMIWNIDELISYISKYFTLKIGDIIFTGTPSGVGPVSENDIYKGYLEGKELFNIKIK